MKEGFWLEFIDYVINNRIILIPVLYILGLFIKRAQFIKDKYIPIVLLVFGITFSLLLGHDTIINNIIQGILVTGATVLDHQMMKQLSKDEWFIFKYDFLYDIFILQLLDLLMKF